jgi:hypothetical protein
MGVGYQGQSGTLQQDAVGSILKDYTHASKTFLTNGFQLSPRLKFLYHVYFNINTGQIPQLRNLYGSGTVETLGLMVKSIDLPKYKINTTVMNQYNRKRVVQSKVNYDPCRFTVHDDQSDLIRNLWYNYFTYYYKDATQKYDNIPNQSGSVGLTEGKSNGFNYNTSDIYSQVYQSADWGFVGESYTDGANAATNSNGKPAFFKDITIYALSQKKYAAWVLINPIISSWNGDMFDYASGDGTMKDDVTVEYETVKYYSGAIGGQQPSTSVKGFAEPAYYDTQPSSITRPGATNSVFGQTGIQPAVQGTTQDLQALSTGRNGLQNVIGGVQQPIPNSLTGQSAVQSVSPALQASATQSALQSTPNSTRAAVNSSTGMSFPRAASTPTAQTPGSTAVNNGITGALTAGTLGKLSVIPSIAQAQVLAGALGGLIDIGKAVVAGDSVAKAIRNTINGDI